MFSSGVNLSTGDSSADKTAFSFCLYPFLFDVPAKVRLLRLAYRLAQYDAFGGTLLQHPLSGPPGGAARNAGAAGARGHGRANAAGGSGGGSNAGGGGNTGGAAGNAAHASSAASSAATGASGPAQATGGAPAAHTAQTAPAFTVPPAEGAPPPPDPACPHLVLSVRRPPLLVGDALRQVAAVLAASPSCLRKPLRVRFVGEQGHDEGGVQVGRRAVGSSRLHWLSCVRCVLHRYGGVRCLRQWYSLRCEA